MNKNFDIKNLGAKGVSIQNLANVNPINSINNDFKKQMDDLQRSVEEKKRLEAEYNQDVLNALKNIEKNTGNLSEIVLLLNEGNIARNEMYELLSRMFSILNTQSKEEAESIYRQVMKDASDFNTTVDAINKISNFGLMLINLMYLGS